MIPRSVMAIGASVALSAGEAVAAEPVRVFAAGSLRAVMTELAAAWSQRGGGGVVAEYGPSGLLRERIVKGERADVFASANLEHPQSLVDDGKAGTVVRFARNTLCALVAPGTRVTPATLLDRLLDPAVRLGTSTPKADPSGDYAFALFDKAEALRPGASKVLAGKAQQLTGGPNSPPPPPDRNVYGMLVAEGRVDIFLTYCTNALAARKEHPALVVVAIPQALAVGADYGLTVLAGAPAAAGDFARYVASEDGRRIISAHGFAAPTNDSTPR